MSRHFKPDKHKRIRRNHERKQGTSPTKNQTPPKIYSPTLFKPKPTDTTTYYTVDPRKKLDIKEVEVKLCELYGFKVKVFPQIFNCFDVLLIGNKRTWETVTEITLKLLEEYE